MAFYVAGSGPYEEFLQNQSFADDAKRTVASARKSISFDIDRQTRELIASRKDLEEMNIRVRERAVDAMERVSDTLSIGFSGVNTRLSAIHDDLGEISGQLDGIHGAIHDLTLCLRTGFAETIHALGRANDQLSQLIHLAKTPAQTKAYEYFEIARDAYRRRLYAESIEYLDTAIQGDHTSTGYKLEWRFHHLLGTIRLGFVGGDISLIDLAAAEQAFLNAARYAQTDDPQQAADEYLLAGWAAYCQSDFETALKHTEATLRLKPQSADARYQAAKISMASGRVAPGLKYLREAIDVEVIYALQAAGDGDFTRHHDAFTRVMDALRNRDAQKAQKAIADAEDRLGGLRKPFNAHPAESLKRAKDAYAQNTIVGHRSAAALAAEAMALAPAAYEKQKYNDEADALRNSALETLAKLEAATDAAQRTIDRTAANEKSDPRIVEPELSKLRSLNSDIRKLLSSKDIADINKGRRKLDVAMPIPNILVQLAKARKDEREIAELDERLLSLDRDPRLNSDFGKKLGGVVGVLAFIPVIQLNHWSAVINVVNSYPESFHEGFRRRLQQGLPVKWHNLDPLTHLIAFFGNVCLWGVLLLICIIVSGALHTAYKRAVGASNQSTSQKLRRRRDILAHEVGVVKSDLADRWRWLQLLDSLRLSKHAHPIFRDIPVVDLKSYSVYDTPLIAVPAELARQYGVLPIALTGDILALAMVDPGDELAVEDISQFTGYRIERMHADPTELKQALDRYYPKSR